MCTRSPPDADESRPSGRKSKPRNRRGLRPDGRSAGARRLKALISAYSADLAGELSQVDQTLIRTAATLTLKMELVEADLASGKTVDSDELIRLASTSRRALAAVTATVTDRKPSGETLPQYLARKAAERDDDGDGEDDA
jgi:hypothetical protein